MKKTTPNLRTNFALLVVCFCTTLSFGQNLYDSNGTIIWDATVKFYTKTIDTICKEYYVELIDYVQCDVEGYDLKVLSKFDFVKYKPNIVKFESRNIPNELHKAKQLFEQYNYNVYQLGGDCLAIHNDHENNLKKNLRWREVLLLENAETDNVPAFFDQDIDSNSYITEI